MLSLFFLIYYAHAKLCKEKTMCHRTPPLRLPSAPLTDPPLIAPLIFLFSRHELFARSSLTHALPLALPSASFCPSNCYPEPTCSPTTDHLTSSHRRFNFHSSTPRQSCPSLPVFQRQLSTPTQFCSQWKLKFLSAGLVNPCGWKQVIFAAV